jgi:hypothetical protein
MILCLALSVVVRCGVTSLFFLPRLNHFLKSPCLLLQIHESVNRFDKEFFYQLCMGRRLALFLAAFWRIKIFGGRNPPPIFMLHFHA